MPRSGRACRCRKRRLCEEGVDLGGQASHVLTGTEIHADGSCCPGVRRLVTPRFADDEPQRDVAASVMTRVDAKVVFQRLPPTKPPPTRGRLHKLGGPLI
jgi:hypothetical protein